LKRNIILASSSRYRRALLRRLQVPFRSVAPDIDETPLPGESAPATARRLAIAKTHALAPIGSNVLIIGSDQTAVVEGQLIGKPGNLRAAVTQLGLLSGKTAVFHTAVCVLDTATRRHQCRIVPTVVRFRAFSPSQARRYVQLERPYDCAGSARIESLGIVLVKTVKSSDPTALIGLPLIALTSMLQDAGVIVV